MKLAKVIGWIGLAAMTVALLNGFINGSFSEDGAMILSNPWGIVSFVDLYVGFIIFSLWMILREKNILKLTLWIVAMMVLGFFTGSLYLLYAAYQSKNDWLKFILGDRKQAILKQSGFDQT